MLIHIHDSQNESMANKNATIGGIVYSENEKLERTYYSITVAHIFAPTICYENSEEYGIDFAFCGESCEDESEELVDETSRGRTVEKL